MKTFRLITPQRIVDHVRDISPDYLLSKGLTTVLLDLDNTLTHWNSNDVDEEVVDWIKSLKAAGLKPCIVSNNKRRRIETVAQKLDIPFVFRAAKPRKGAYRKALEVMHSEKHNTVFIGDQIFTDVYGANRMHLFAILVRPMHNKEFFGTKIMRRIEKLVMPLITPNE